jgi:glyoxylase-like metal-dependent hydrolase (beta-lactamase superfamily II)
MSDGTVCIDLMHLGVEGAIGCYVLAGGEPTLVDPGPSTTFEHLRDRLGDLGLGARDLRHVLLTHVHLDHAGATGHLVREYPEAVVHVHSEGAPHLVDPSRLVASTRRTFKEAHDRLWGEVLPVPADRIRAWQGGAKGPWRGLRPLPTPGHIRHHLAYLDERDGTLYVGDAMGIVLGPDVPSLPATPPPAVDLGAWRHTLTEIAGIGAGRFGAAHFGFHGNVGARCRLLQERLDALEARVRVAMETSDADDAERYEREVRDELEPLVGAERVARYFDTFSLATDWAGVEFYLERSP